ncbi:MAG TPA: protein-disulfide reductase DsbD family protein, partial [Elusimicrobiota bacterium]|nr:protein-disulfide reductase DsbD family protein [Elusimicrobiota bacterium]
MISSKINALPTPLRILFVSAVLGLTVFSQAAEKTAGHVQAAIVAEDLRASAGGTSWVGVRLTMAPGWHTYWKNPGDSGMATRIRWALPPTVTAGDILWPAPERIVLPPLVSFGYEKETLLLVPLQIAQGATGPVKLSARVDWLECSDVCVPGRADLELRLNVGPRARPNPATAELFARFRSRLPRPPDNWTLEARRSGKSVKVSLQPPPGANISSKALTLFPEDEDTAEAGAV